MTRRGSKTSFLASLVHPSECGAFSNTFPDIVDVKNPSDGSLGMPNAQIVRAIRSRVPGTIPLSVAIGDATDEPEVYIDRAVKAASCGADFVKVGLYDFTDRGAELRFLEKLCGAVDIAVVAAWYADRLCGRDVSSIPAPAKSAGVSGCLLDTYKKDGKKITDCLDFKALGGFIKACADQSVFSAVAGGLGLDDARWIRELAPDVAGFRGAIASGARSGTGLDRDAVDSIRKMLCRRPSAVSPACN